MQASNPIRQGVKLERPQPGRNGPSILSAKFWRGPFDLLEALAGMEVRFFKSSSTEPSGKLNLSESNAKLDIYLPQLGGGTSSGGTKEMLVKTVYGDHLDCCEITDPGLSGTTTAVAKSARNRRSLGSETLPKTDGTGNVTITYTYAAISGFMDYGRTAAATGFTTQYEILFPFYKSGDIILVNQIASVTLDGVACTWEEATPRRWAQYK